MPLTRQSSQENSTKTYSTVYTTFKGRRKKIHFMLISFQFTYNAEGKMLKPLMLHSGDVTPFIEDFYGRQMEFLKTESGLIDRDAVCFAFDQIQR